MGVHPAVHLRYDLLSPTTKRRAHTSWRVPIGPVCFVSSAESDPEELFLLGLELLVAEDALIAELGELLQLSHVLRLG